MTRDLSQLVHAAQRKRVRNWSADVRLALHPMATVAHTTSVDGPIGQPAARRSDSRVVIDGISISYPGTATAVSDADLIIESGSIVALLGPSGCGKTSLLRAIAGLERPRTGSIRIGDTLVSDGRTWVRPERRNVGMVFQDGSLFPHLSVAANVGFGLRTRGADRARRIEELLALVDLEALGDRLPDTLSGGQQQRVALARALAPKPKVLLLDEPLSALDFKLRKEMQVELKRLQNETGITFIFVTHDQEEALTMSDRVAVMRDGLILQVGTPSEIYDRPARRFVADFIGDINILKGSIVSRNGSRAKVKLEAGHEGEAGLPTNAESLGQEVSIAIRPEQLSFVTEAAAAHLSGAIEHISYFGSGFDYQILMPTGEKVMLQSQNRGGENLAFQLGDQVHIAISDNSMQILAD